MCLAVADQFGVPLPPHQLHQLGLVGDEDRLQGDVRLGVARAVPVEVVPAGAPAATVVLTDRDLRVGRPVLPLDGAHFGRLIARSVHTCEALFDRVKVTRRDASVPARDFSAYEVTVGELPAGVVRVATA